MKQAFTFIAGALLTILTSCENNKKQCYQFTAKMAGQTVITYENCTKAVAEETVKQLKAKGATSASYEVVDSSKCNGKTTSTPSTTTTTNEKTCWFVDYFYHADHITRYFYTEAEAKKFYDSIKKGVYYRMVTMYSDKCN